MSDYPTPEIVEYVLTALSPTTTDPDAKMVALFEGIAISPEETVGIIFGLTVGILDAIELRTHGLITGAEVFADLAEGVRCRIAAAIADEAAALDRQP